MIITPKLIIDQLTAGIPMPAQTVDRLKPGSPQMEVRGIVTAFSASQHVIEQALALGANFIITHEGVYFSHQDHQEWLEHDSVYRQKANLIANAGLGIYRFHDGLHRSKPDGIMEGLLHELEWQSYVTEHRTEVSILTIPVMEAEAVAAYVKRKLHIPYVRIAGKLSVSCARVGILVGYRGSGAAAIPLYEQDNLDLIIAGEGPEWETPEYVRDAARQGNNKALIMLGHAESETPGMKLLAERLSAAYPGLPVHFIKDQPVFQVV
ncbi:Nif3-like dinuclear metal center hexameric protein [Paenibacillus donghaensis]|uniref:GTP cyclohydrolase 1 type 2 homolog n=1 Tax=Paenibacillus donghaensis TaxID=414771 RepID=A0A2Z2KLC5_9BACL|nr:Nif3-like dinuclear metal center hexameric protein [Paenibacillus donghaensis]ASA23269.1 transcriptional regulator [Paenibacillus donghaensis]